MTLSTRDGKRLFVSESHKNRILAYDVLSPGKVGLQKVFAELSIKQGEQIDNKPNGICQDSKGNFYVAHYGMRQVQVLNSNGHLMSGRWFRRNLPPRSGGAWTSAFSAIARIAQYAW